MSACGPKQESGQAVVKGKALTPLAEATVHVYREGMDLKGPAYATSQATGEDGDFSVALPPGKYFFVLRKRAQGDSVGPVRTGDYHSEVVGPVTVRSGETIDRDLVAVRKIGETKDLPSTTPAPSTVIATELEAVSLDACVPVEVAIQFCTCILGLTPAESYISDHPVPGEYGEPLEGIPYTTKKKRRRY